MQKKEEVHEYHSEAYTGSLSMEIELLHWCLAQILTLKRIYNSKSRWGNKSKKVIFQYRDQKTSDSFKGMRNQCMKEC
jgi:hypothetical protein